VDAGRGKAGMVYGKTDEFSYIRIENELHYTISGYLYIVFGNGSEKPP